MKVDKQLESGDSGVIGEKYVKEVLQDTNERNCSLTECEKEKLKMPYIWNFLN